jgi:hypothetical protein
MVGHDGDVVGPVQAVVDIDTEVLAGVFGGKVFIFPVC